MKKILIALVLVCSTLTTSCSTDEPQIQSNSITQPIGESNMLHIESTQWFDMIRVDVLDEQGNILETVTVEDTWILNMPINHGSTLNIALFKQGNFDVKYALLKGHGPETIFSDEVPFARDEYYITKNY